MAYRKSYRSSSAKGRKTLTTFLRLLLTKKAIRNPPKALDVPPEYVTNPYKPIPKSYSKAKHRRIAELREAYVWAMNRQFDRKVLRDPETVARLLAPLMAPLDTKVLILLPLDVKSQLIGDPVTISKGDVDGTDAGPRLVSRTAVQSGAVSMIIAHNHPTGSAIPSAADLNVTSRLIKAGHTIDVPLVDHIVIGHHGEHTSIRRTNPSLWAQSNPRYTEKRKNNRSKVSTDFRRNPASEGMLLGELVEMCVRTPNGREQTIKPVGKLIGWIPSSRTLCVLKKRRGKVVNHLSTSVVNLHKRFHNSRPTKAAQYEWPDPAGSKRAIGRIVSLTYRIPKGLKSPEKTKYIWHHEFGDHGERGHGPVGESGDYPETLMPTLQKDERGNLFIKRNPGNKYYVKEWLYW